MTPPGAVDRAHADRLLAILPDAPAPGVDRINILVIDSDETTAEVLRTHLPRTDAAILFACTIEAARELLAATPVAVILCNPAVAGRAAWRFFSQLTEHAARAGMPVIALRSEADILSEVELYLLGVDAILAHPFQRSALIALVRSHLRKIVQRRVRLLQDPVTGNPNAGVFREAFQRAASLAARERTPLSLLVLHVGALTRLRREQGAEAADDLLKEVSTGVARTLRQSDFLARGEGDTLLVLLPNTDAAGAARVIEKTSDRLARTRLISGIPEDDLLLSAGVAEAAPRAPFDQVVETAVAGLQPIRGALQRAMAEEEMPAAATPRRILVAEDDDLTASIIRHRLEGLGCEVLRAHDGASVLKLAPESNLSLLILDVKMPYVDGFEALRRLRSIRALRSLPVMLVTSMGNEEDIARGFDLGADDYLVKPFSPIELQARVQRLLR
jgi:two-component system cell cycle response regulator